MNRRYSHAVNTTFSAFTSVRAVEEISSIDKVQRTELPSTLSDSYLLNSAPRILGNTTELTVAFASLNSDDFQVSSWLIYVALAFGSIFSILGFFGNSITIYAYRRHRKLRTSFNFLIINLCAVDLVFSVLIIPPHLFIMGLQSRIFGQFGCVILRYSCYTAISSSAINLVCIAINRYVGIVHSKLKFWIIGIWFASPLFYFPPVIIKTMQRATSASRCGIFSTEIEESWLRLYLTLLIALLQVLPVIVLTGFYRAILVKVKKCRKTVEHHPMTNTPTYFGSYMGHSCAMRSTNSPDCSLVQTTAGLKRSSLRRGSSKKSDNDTACGRNDDVKEGRQAIIMAYLEVPPASVSPRKNPGTLYKRSPPQTRTMVVELDNEEKNQVLISGTTSSPNLCDKAGASYGDTDTRHRSDVGWGRQRSFSTGDEEIEPERGMVGDNETDLKQQNSFTMSESTQSFEDDSTPQSTPPIDATETNHHFQYERKSGKNFLKTNDCCANKDRIVGQNKNPASNMCNVTSHLAKPQILSSPRFLDIPHPSTDSIDRMGLNEVRSLRIKRRQRGALTRQSSVTEGELIASSVDIKKNPSMITFSKRIAKKQDSSIIEFSNQKEACSPRRQRIEDSSRDNALGENIVCSPTINSTNHLALCQPYDRSNISQKACFNTINNSVDVCPPSQDTTINDSGAAASSKRYLYRRGGSDRTGVKWLGRFRKSKNWSVTSMIPPKLKNRANSESRNNTVIKIVIDHATEEVSETWLHDDNNETETDSPNDVFPNKTPEGEGNNLSIIPEQMTNPSEISLNKGFSNPATPSSAVPNEINTRSWLSIFRKTRRSFLTNSNMDTSKDAMSATLSREKDTEETVRKHPVNEKKQHFDKKKQPCIPTALWSKIPEISSTTNKPVVILPMPSFSMCSSGPKSPIEADGLEFKMAHIDSDSTCKSSQHELSDCDDSIRTSSNYGNRDSDLSSREDADLLSKRKEMIESTQYLRAKITPKKQEDNQSFLDLNSVDLGRRWSVQSDAISMYSERIARPIERSHSNYSRYSQKRESKRSVSSDNQGGSRRSFRRKWSSKKSSFASSTGSSFKRKYRRNAERKLVYSGISICVAFGLCMIPISIVDILQMTIDYDFLPEIRISLIVLSWAHVVANPMLYGFLNSQFRKEYKRISKDLRNFFTRKNRSRGLLSGRSAIVKAMRDQYQG